MELDKEEKLKAVLNQTLSQEDIEKKLKKEIKEVKKKQKKQKKLEEQEALEKKEEEQSINEEPKVQEEIKTIDDTQPEPIIIPKVPKKPLEEEENKLPINTLIYIFSGITIILLVITIYLFMKQPKQKVVIKQVPIEKIKEVKVEVVKEKIVPKIVDLGNENFNQYYNALKFNSLKCYNFSKGSSRLTNECSKKINKFFEENKKSVRFEIIPVIAQDDNTIFNKIKPKITDLEKSFQNKVEEYILRGLSRERVLETSSYIRKNFDENIILTPTNYYVKSQKNNKGVIIKAYYQEN